jgi:hypothetical protein
MQKELLSVEFKRAFLFEFHILYSQRSSEKIKE